LADQSSSPLGVPPTLWVVLVVGLVGAFAANHRPFQDARPPDPNVPAYRHTPPDDQDVEAREWEDPFTAVAISRRNEADATTTGASPHDLRRLAADAHANVRDALLVMGAMVPGAPYTDDSETRRRTRYAVLAGLSSAGYVPDDSQHIGYVNLAVSTDDAAPVREIAAYEWFHLELSTDTKDRPRVLVLWLDQDNFRQAPLRRFSEIVGAIAPEQAGAGTVSQVILGPADSDGLREMSSELDQGCNSLPEPRRNISVYSPRATALDWWIVSEAVKQRYPDTESEPHADHFNDRCEHVFLYRTIASDFTVAKALYRELKFRGIQSVGEIALITERDTLYARLVSRHFNGCDGSDDAIDKRFTVADDADKAKPLCFTYLRGLDGLAPPAPDASAAAHATAAKAGAAPAAAAAAAPDTASGQRQFDYLRRLTLELASLRDDPRCRWISKTLNLGDPAAGHRCMRRIKAIGVVGSDLYDKLLVLQALRSAFPRYVFFTTDLDARLTDEQSLAWTHELIVGSTLGLSLRSELQGSIPPFRDTYQATTYYSTLHAVEHFLEKRATPGAVIDLAWTRHPHVFEIGRTQAFDLTIDREANATCTTRVNCRSIADAVSPPLWSTRSAGSSLIVAATAMLAMMIIGGLAMGDVWVGQLIAPLFSVRSNPRERRRLLATGGALLAAALLSIWAWASLVGALTDQNHRIPPPMFSGASHWAASMIEALSILVVITLVIRGQRKLGVNARELLKHFEFPTPSGQLVQFYVEWLRSPATSSRRRWKERVWLPLRRLSGNKNDPLPANELSALENLIAQYLYRGRWRARLMRVGFITVLASFLLLVLEYILMIFEFNLGISFVRGFALVDTHYVERGIEDLISLLNLLAVQFLIFWVADAMLLTRSFVLALREDKPSWPEPVIALQMKELGLPKEWTTLWIDLRLIAWRTGWVASLIWYPSLMIAAMAAAALTVAFGEFGFASNPIALVISAAFVVGAAVMLRRVAEAWRNDVLFKLADARLQGFAPANQGQVNVAQLDRLSDRVMALRDGAFAPYSQQPLVRAVLVPALTYGATAGVQFLHLGN
jgi:hypothetical protein